MVPINIRSGPDLEAAAVNNLSLYWDHGILWILTLIPVFLVKASTIGFTAVSASPPYQKVIVLLFVFEPDELLLLPQPTRSRAAAAAATEIPNHFANFIVNSSIFGIRNRNVSTTMIIHESEPVTTIFCDFFQALRKPIMTAYGTAPAAFQNSLYRYGDMVIRIER